MKVTVSPIEDNYYEEGQSMMPVSLKKYRNIQHLTRKYPKHIFRTRLRKKKVHDVSSHKF